MSIENYIHKHNNRGKVSVINDKTQEQVSIVSQ